MYRTGLSSRLRSRHYLPQASSREQKEHSHDYLVEVTVAGRELDGKGYLIDIDELKAALSVVLERYEGRCLNELPEFHVLPPSLENLSREVHDRLRDRLGNPSVSISVKIWEDQAAWADYEGAPA